MKFIDDVEFKKPEITIGTHYFRVNNAVGKVARAISDYAQQYVQMGFSRERGPNGRPKFEVKARFYSFAPIQNEFRFNIEQLNGLLDFFEKQYIGPTDIDIKSKEHIKGDEVHIKLRSGWVLRDYQVEVKKFILNKDVSNSRSRLASLPTGTGKTVIALGTAVEMNTRIGIPSPAGYTDKWKKDVLEQYELDEDQVYMATSRIKLIKAFKLAKTGIKYPVYIFSQETLASFFKEFEKNYFEGIEDYWNCHPEDFLELLGIGVTIIDETHEAINMVFRMMTYMNVPLIIGLSGTLRSRDEFILKIQGLMYPAEIRYDKVKMAKYIAFKPTIYTFANFFKSGIKTMAFGNNMYSQAIFEASVYKNKNKTIFKNFLEMIDHYFVEDYVKRKIEGKKCAIYVARVELCSLIVAYLKKKHPEMDIRKYTGEDPFENAIEADVRVTTRGSCGTAIDIKGLISLITFDNVDSDVGNLQLLGRLREDKDITPFFRQLLCDKIEKHKGYQKTRHSTFADRIISCDYERYSQPLDIEKGTQPLSSYA